MLSSQPQQLPLFQYFNGNGCDDDDVKTNLLHNLGILDDDSDTSSFDP